MRLLVDESVGRRLASLLQLQRHDVLYVGDVAAGATDEEVMSFAEKEKRVLGIPHHQPLFSTTAETLRDSWNRGSQRAIASGPLNNRQSTASARTSAAFRTLRQLRHGLLLRCQGPRRPQGPRG
ncbi:MAG: DUF5615 family PIN-like protein [Candidatus Aenigmarchaeota archaeon]|nr:DUF5615 family PIN-like protein [Candidatus Aenigmarchaeota archaeon]